MCWVAKTRVPVTANSMSLDRFFKIRQSIKVTKDLDVSDEEKKSDALWKAGVLYGSLCLGNQIPAFVLAGPNDLVLDFEVYKGQNMFTAQSKMSDGTKLQKQGRGIFEMVVRKPPEVTVTKWQDNKAVLMASVIEPQDSCMRWSVKLKCHDTVPRPTVEAEYNKNMGGVVLCDRMTSFYPKSNHIRKWTVRRVLHFFYLAATNSWIEYRSDYQVSGRPERERMQYSDFKLLLAEEIIAQAQDG
ncbi:piggyBac transposable element-derived protein 3-like protein [Lates japonicus]|uniref:PiggyBac transposable element-derived protein 3-like protein n=1 Tax=Lates japonicus TaxID=270547 RepID=A0AAD3M7G2_LATJO|nr:piggyBac transposable element-derived protein 3-like protein [Lates japonicus]